MSSVMKVTPRPVTPLGILVEHLETAVEMVEKEAISAPVKSHLQSALHLAAGLDSYLDECTSDESPGLRAIAQKSVYQDSTCYLVQYQESPLTLVAPPT